MKCLKVSSCDQSLSVCHTFLLAQWIISKILALVRNSYLTYAVSCGLFSGCIVRPNKKISVFRVTGLKIIGRVGTHIFYFIFLECNTT